MPNSYNESKLVKTHARNPLVYPNDPFNINKTLEWALNSGP